MKLSVVTTLFRSEATVAAFVERAAATAEAITPDYEIIMVDDGSPDGSLSIATSLARDNPKLTVVELSRNFGHHNALMTGLAHAKGEYCFLIDSDLEEAPELLGRFWELMHAEERDVVYGLQQRRSGNLVKRVAGAAAYKVFDALLSVRIPTNHLTVRLMRRTYVDALLLHRETQLVIGGLWVIAGFRQHGVFVDKLDKGQTSYSLRRRWNILLNSVTNFSAAPLIAIFYVGLILSFVSIVFGTFLLIRWMVGGVAVAGWVSVMLSVWLLGGLGILFMGIIGIYLSKVFLETKNRPLAIVRKVHGQIDVESRR